MKHLLKKLARPLWRISGPIRRPLVRKFDRHAMDLLHLIPRPPAVPAELELVLNSVVRELARPPAMPAELDLTLNSVVRELGRLQMQVEALQHQLDERRSSDRDPARAEGRLSVVAETG